MALSSSSIAFKVTRQKHELITPSKPTPRELKPLSDVDDHNGLRFHIPFIFIYRHNPAMKGKDPVKVIREALAETLVFYYPFAGRLREGPGRKLFVDCTGEGVLFIEADADVNIEDGFGDELAPPFPCLEELLYDVPGYSGILHCPLVLIQVTCMLCGGFIFAIRFNHTMSDAWGLTQFIKAIAEIARGSAKTPSIIPVWEREKFLTARNPPRVTCKHTEFEQTTPTTTYTTHNTNNYDNATVIISSEPKLLESFFFSPAEFTTLRSLLPPRLQNCTRFELLTACLWRCRTIAISTHPNEEARVLCIVNARGKSFSGSTTTTTLPVGYYGNGFAVPMAITTTGELAQNPLGYAVELIAKTKSLVNGEYMRSFADLMVIKERPMFTLVRTLFGVSDVTRAGMEDIDFGWGRSDFAGPADATPEFVSFYIPYRNRRGVFGSLAAMCLPPAAMDRFKVELRKLLKKDASLRATGEDDNYSSSSST